MKYLLQEKSFYQEINYALQQFATKHLDLNFSKGLFTFLEIALLIIILIIIAYILKLIFIPLLKKIGIATDSPLLNSLIQHKVVEYSLYIIPLSLAFNFNMILFRDSR